MGKIKISNVIAVLDRDHANIAQLLDILESEILGIEVGKTPDFSLLQDIMRYMTKYPDRFHHPKEDVIFERLAKRHPEARADVDDILNEHVTVGLVGQKFEKLLCMSGVDSIKARERLKTAGFAYVRALRRHMSIEEKKLFPLAIEVLTESDWQAIDEEVALLEDPLFGEMVADDYRRLYRLITDRRLVSS
jgi:hemerythrin-like domain-containing protein